MSLDDFLPYCYITPALMKMKKYSWRMKNPANYPIGYETAWLCFNSLPRWEPPKVELCLLTTGLRHEWRLFLAHLPPSLLNSNICQPLSLFSSHLLAKLAVLGSCMWKVAKQNLLYNIQTGWVYSCGNNLNPKGYSYHSLSHTRTLVQCFKCPSVKEFHWQP